MNKSSIETAVGIFLIIGIACTSYLSVKLGEFEWFEQNYYPVQARFQSVTGLKTGAHVEMAGVHIGKVEEISLDIEKEVALVKMKIQEDVALTEDVIASVKTSGLIGDKFVKLSPGGSDDVLKPGDFITETESALDIEDLVGKYVFGSVEKK
ncbi:outer membrane lipid asymmetry maintenance protein MlaD [Thermodesulfobacteriota bacterium]